MLGLTWVRPILVAQRDATPFTPTVYRLGWSKAGYVPPNDPQNHGGRGDKMSPNRPGGTRVPEPSKEKESTKEKEEGEEPFGEATRKWYRSLAEDVQAHNLRALHGMLAG